MGLGRCVVTHIICTIMQKKISCTVVFNTIFSLTIGGISLLSCIYVPGRKSITVCEYQVWVFLNYCFVSF